MRILGNVEAAQGPMSSSPSMLPRLRFMGFGGGFATSGR